MRHTAHTSEVDAPQVEQGAREGAGDDMAAVGAGGQREAREIARAGTRSADAALQVRQLRSAQVRVGERARAKMNLLATLRSLLAAA